MLKLAGAEAKTVLGYTVGGRTAGDKGGPVSFVGVAGSGEIDALTCAKSSIHADIERSSLRARL